ncbi:variant erythrocyte surface antigen-1 family protein [Babesia divergens]|uniref:Variant erythrocyte surface antigen-1 family protein n=1 Tax=Babesia divergens TaxID=32595 RepID=A0AAD9G5H1_BABDI|nr:variant erythrocyte surface antigen-1 family protein [Babesia divergens]
MYYTDVFVGSKDNINKLNKALNAELKDFDDNSDDLSQLVQGLCLFMGYPSCLCSLKANVDKSLKDISKELKKELNFYKCSSITIPKLDLNCDSCSTSVVCKCCVLDCINEVLKSNCKCVKNSNNTCTCSSVEPKRCCKDLLEKLKASLSLLNLKADMEKLCECTENCCVKGVCTQKDSSTCPVCNNLKTLKDYTVTGLGLLRPSPKRLAGRLETFFGSSGKPKSVCSCKCGSDKSCCCLACQDCSEACSCSSSGSQCNHQPQPQSSPCPCKDFCIKINSIKVTVGSSLMRCCEGGQKCHCGLTSGSGTNCSGDCCKERNKQSLKCMIRRLVTYFNSLGPNPSKSEFSKKCCDLLCVAKTCEFLKMFYDKDDSKDFKKHLETLKYSSPCGHELWRTLEDFLYYCVHMVGAYVQSIKDKLKGTCPQCPPTGRPQQHSCNCNGQCKGCKELLGDSHLMGILTRKFSSSYDSSNAKWDSLCSSKPCCSNPSCNSCTSGSCPPQGCCEKCPKRLCAKIFLGFLPCLYYGLKILYDRSQDPVTWPDWQYISVYSNDKPSSDLAKFFYAWGYDVKPLKNKKGFDIFPILGILFSSGSLNSLFETSKKYFTSSSLSRSSLPSGSTPKSPSDPSTVRSMLLWLYGLRFHKHFSDLVENCKSLCSPFGNSFNADAFCYYIHTCSFILPVAIISFIEDSSSAQKVFSSSSEWQNFSYPSDSSALADMFFHYIRKIYTALNFLKFQCERDKNSAGWRDCAFGQGCKEGLESSLSTSTPGSSCCQSSGSHGILCTSVPGVSNYHEHCTSSKPEVKCIGLEKCNQVSGSAPTDAHSSGDTKCKPSCPHPLLMFLIDGSLGSESFPQPQSKDYPFALPGIVPMGFSKEKLPEKAHSGQNLYHVIEPFCKDGFCPLTRLVQFILCISQRPPETLGEFFIFFKKFVEALNSKPDLSSKFVDWINGEPGSYPGKALKDAVQGLYGSHSGSSHSPANLFSLSDCRAPKSSKATCGPYLHALTDKASGVFTPELCSMYLSWICYRGPTFYSEFKRFHKEAQEKFSCCLKSSGSSCPKIVECPCALPFIYSQGFTFMSPSGLNCVDSWGQEHEARNGVKGHESENEKENSEHCTRKTCSQFITQLRLVAEGQPFKDLLKEIEKFLWSIRLPFFLFVLAFWAFVISYFLYVQLYKLDLLHLKSHAHFSRSFKILPSTLFSDASSKLKDLSYFTL